MPIKPGNFVSNPTDYSRFVDSMADEMDRALRDLMALDGLPPLRMDPNDRETRDRRRLFVAIARGVARHLDDRADSFKITLPGPGSVVVTPNIDVDMS
jgi:hypothetical protein